MLVGGGDFSLAPDPIGTLRSEIMRDAMAAMDYDAVVPGERELSMGMDFLDILAREIPLLSCNLVHEGESFGRPYLVIERNGLKIGLIGVTHIVGKGRIPEGWEIRNPEEAISGIVEEVKGKTDLLVGLFHTDLKYGEELSARFQEFDVTILAHGSRKLNEPLLMGKTIVLKGEMKARSLGRIDLEIGSDGTVTQKSAAYIPLGKDIRNHPGMMGFLDDFNKRRKELAQKRKEQPASQ